MNSATMTDRRTLRMREMTKWIGASDRTIRGWIADEGMPCVKIGGCLLFPLAEVEQWLQSRIQTSKQNKD